VTDGPDRRPRAIGTVRDVVVALAITLAGAALLPRAFDLERAAVSSPARVVSGEVAAAVAVTWLVAKWNWWRRTGWRAPRWPSLWLLWLPVLLLVESNLSDHSGSVGTRTVVLGVVAVLLVGYTEEMWFRGVILGSLQSRSPRSAVLVSAAAFGLLHVTNARALGLSASIGQAVGALAIGLAFGAARVRIRSIAPLIVLHAAFDLAFTIGLAPAPSPLTARELPSLVVLDLVCLVYALVLTRRSKTREPVAATTSPG
jgi:membrane protease YdiL (CAAX protease family)